MKGEVINLLVKKWKIAEKSVELVCEALKTATESCPYDLWDKQVKDCDNECENNYRGECFKLFFIKEAMKELGYEEEVCNETEI